MGSRYTAGHLDGMIRIVPTVGTHLWNASDGRKIFEFSPYPGPMASSPLPDGIAPPVFPHRMAAGTDPGGPGHRFMGSVPVF